ncbi:hypothetical protein [Streptomyces sp. MMBL 11-1]|uniref:hypothetical protein n=1 Tax=Streptomyces sp. MMBL 11-1 TaxID=3026420 RepID=UPI00235FCC3D|nr:hypothetical protein [Streptomyces sp. MMBL 11-1]
MDQEQCWRRVLLWQRRFLLAAFAVGVAGGAVAARSGDGLPAGQLAAVAVIASAGLVWNARHLRRQHRASRTPVDTPSGEAT